MKTRCAKLFCLFAVILWMVSGALARVKLPHVFSDHMVLQRGKPVPVWGWAEKGEKVTVKFAGQEKTGTAGDDGTWTVKLDAMEAQKRPQTMTVSCKNTLTLKDVLVGDVWVCSGQSNMAFTVGGSLNARQEITTAAYPAIRHFGVPRNMRTAPANDVAGQWARCSPKTVSRFTAVGYFFGRRLHKELDVPIGLLGSSWGGTRIEPWTPPEGFRAVPQLKAVAEQIDRFDPRTDAGKKLWSGYVAKVKEWVPRAERAIARGKGLPPLPPNLAAGARMGPATLYNGMIHPLVPYAIRGAIWYQGESNGGEGLSYFHKMQALIRGWRQVWGQGDFPFYFVQLANFRTSDPKNAAGGDGWARLREAQRKALEIPNTGMAVIIDIGEARDIHPRNKQDVGDRLARLALAKLFEKNVVPSGPLYKSHAVEGNKIRVAFDHVGAGLIVGEKKGLDPVREVKDAKLGWFAVAGADKKWHRADAVIDGKTVVVSSAKVAEPSAVRYAYAMNPAGANLYNKDGLPASPFRTDDW